MRIPLWRRKQDEALEEEVRSHLAMAVRDRMERGESRSEAEAAARRQFGNALLVREVTRDTWGWASLDRLVQDVRYGWRVLRKTPGFTLIAILTLALGIGANTALFSIVNGVLLKPLPYPHPQQLVTLHMRKPNFDTGAISYPNFKDWQSQNHTFSSMALSRGGAITLLGQGQPEYLRVNYVTADFFSLLGVNPLIGRNFAGDEDRLGGPTLVQISEGLWKRKFGGGAVLGRALNLSGKSYTVIGVIPASFDLQLINFTATDIYLPMGQWANPALKMRGAPLGLHGIGRIRDGVTLEQARADMDSVSRNIADAYPDTNRNNSANLIPLRQSVLGGTGPVLLLLLGAVGFVLLIACVNVASLLLARSEARSQEFAVRAALGASRTRILRQLLTESVLLASIGGGLGIVMASWGTSAALRLLPRGIPRMQHVGIDMRVLLFSVSISLAAGILFGLAPALKTSRHKLWLRLKSAGRRASAEGHRTQHALVIMEIALALVLLIGAGLMMRSLAQLWRVDPGFDPHNVLAFNVSLAPELNSIAPDAWRALNRQIRDAFESTPGVTAVSLRDGSLPMQSDNELLFWLAGQPQPHSDAEMNWALRYTVQSGYLDVMRTPLLRGRFFSSHDTAKSPRVFVVDDVFANTFFPHQEVLGKRFQFRENGRTVEAEIVGVVEHVKQWGLDADDTNSLRAQAYESYDQLPDDAVGGGFAVSVRTSEPPLALVPELTRRLQQVNGNNALFTPTTLERIIGDSLATRRFVMVLLATFASLALLLAGVGLYGVVSYLVAQRTHEIGIRMALGAQHSDVLKMVVGGGVKLTAIGIVLGIAGALAMTRFMSNLLFGVTAADPATFVTVALLLGAVALAACYLPARRAIRVDPMSSLRHD